MNGSSTAAKPLAQVSTPTGMASGEPGASDNRLSLDPNDEAFGFTKDWEDGNNYRLTVEVTQVSPGEFEVTGASEAPKEEGEEAMPDKEGAMGEAGESPELDRSTTGGDGYRNPAIAKIMG
jgi:hypothetical protein